MESITIKSKNKKDLKIIADLARHLKAEVHNDESPYDPKFVAKVQEADEQIQQGKFTAIKTEDLWK